MKNITLLDGAMGTSIWAKTEDKLPVWTYNITHPEVVQGIYEEYVNAGSQIIFTNSFGANRPSVERTSEYSVEEVVRASVRLAKAATAGTDVKVGLDIGPLSEMLEPYGDLEEEEAIAIYEEQIGAGMLEHPDVIALETFIDLELLRIAATVAVKYGVPVFCSMSFSEIGKTIMGNSVQDMIDVLTPLGVAAVGLNCSLGPDKAVNVIKEFSEKTDLPLIFKPNAGLPVMGENGVESPYTADHFAEEITPALDMVTYLGGCCGSDPSYIRKMKELI